MNALLNETAIDLSADEAPGQGVVPSRYANVTAIIPCLDEAEAIGPCVRAVLAQGVAEVIVVDGGSQDRTVAEAEAGGARVIIERRRGYGRAMMTGIAAALPSSTILLFIDGDGSDRPEMIPAVLAPIEAGAADFVMGSRLYGERELGSMSPAQIVAGRLAGLLIRGLYGTRYTDMSPFRAVRRDVLDRLGMSEPSFGWNLEMQMRAAAAGLRVKEVPVGQRIRAGGVSKVSGNRLVMIRAAWTLGATFLRLALRMRGAQAIRPSQTLRQ